MTVTKSDKQGKNEIATQVPSRRRKHIQHSVIKKCHEFKKLITGDLMLKE
jgi:hypothetical protein